MQTYPEPQLHGPTNDDLLDWALDLRMVNRLYQSDNQALQEWAEAMGE